MATAHRVGFSRNAQRPTTNRLLAGLPLVDYQRLALHLSEIKVDRNQVIQRAGEPIRHVYFPNDGLFSVTAGLPDGAMIEVATIGAEGMLGVEAFFGEDASAPGHTIVEVPGGTLARLDVVAFRHEIASGGALHRLVRRYVPLFIGQTIHVSACNALHNVQQRLARWLLLAIDRLDNGSGLHVSHEFLAVILGARRPTISVAAAALQRAGMISYSHGRLTVRDRARLEATACPCYTVLRTQLAAWRSDLWSEQTSDQALKVGT